MKQCLHCGTEIPEKNKFCNNSCSAKYNNTKQLKREPYEYKCLNCDKEILREYKTTTSVYCNNTCQGNYKTKQSFAEWVSGGKSPSIKPLKIWLLEQQDGKCSSCGITTTWNDKPIVFDLEHIDGNSENNARDNLEVICPNCHSQTDTFKGKNKGNGRHSRRERYKDGKSY